MHSYGWRRSLPDRRDYRYSCRPSIVRALPPMVDLRTHMPPVWDQGQLGSCTAQAVNAVFQFDQMRQSPESFFLPSRLFTYYCERELEGTIPWDAGAEMRDSIKAVVQYGVCPETMWPYFVERFTLRPPDSCYVSALINQGLVYCSVEQTLCQMQGVLASGFPFIFGFSVYESFESIGLDGIMPIPGPSEGVLGGHAVVAVGYDNEVRRFIVRNSWGDWGDRGHFYMPYEFAISQDVADLFVLQTVEEE